MRFAKGFAAAAAMMVVMPSFAASDDLAVVKTIALVKGKPLRVDVALPAATTAVGVNFKGTGADCDDLKMVFASGDPNDVLYHVAVPANFKETYHFAANEQPSVVRSVHVECHATGAAVKLIVSAGR